MQDVIYLELIIKGMFYKLRVDLSGGTDCTALTLVPMKLSIANICSLNSLVLPGFPNLHVIIWMAMTGAGEGRWPHCWHPQITMVLVWFGIFSKTIKNWKDNCNVKCKLLAAMWHTVLFNPMHKTYKSGCVRQRDFWIILRVACQTYAHIAQVVVNGEFSKGF